MVSLSLAVRPVSRETASPKTVAYDFHAISWNDQAFYIHTVNYKYKFITLIFLCNHFVSFELSNPITITHYPEPGGGCIIRLTYYFKAISDLAYVVGLGSFLH